VTLEQQQHQQLNSEDSRKELCNVILCILRAETAARTSSTVMPQRNAMSTGKISEIPDKHIQPLGI